MKLFSTTSTCRRVINIAACICAIASAEGCRTPSSASNTQEFGTFEFCTTNGFHGDRVDSAVNACVASGQFNATQCNQGVNCTGAREFCTTMGFHGDGVDDATAACVTGGGNATQCNQGVSCVSQDDPHYGSCTVTGFTGSDMNEAWRQCMAANNSDPRACYGNMSCTGNKTFCCVHVFATLFYCGNDYSSARAACSAGLSVNPFSSDGVNPAACASAPDAGVTGWPTCK